MIIGKKEKVFCSVISCRLTYLKQKLGQGYSSMGGISVLFIPKILTDYTNTEV